MHQMTETRRAMRERASETSLGGDSSETTPSLLIRQAVHVSERFCVGSSLALVIAEHAFARRPGR